MRAPVLRGPLATIVAAVVVGAVVGLGAPHVTPEPVPLAPPTPTTAPPPEAVMPPAAPDDPEAALLRERLGGLAALALPPGPLLDACAAVELASVPPAEDTDAVVTSTEALRELAFDEPVEVRLIPPEEMVAEVEERFAARGDPERVERERRILERLGAIGEDVDLAELRVSAFAEHVSGLHVGADGLVLVRVEDPDRLHPLERVVLAHEIEHALTFQHLGRPAHHRDHAEDDDERLASLAVVEGSATLLMLQYAWTVLDDDERDELRDALLGRAVEGPLGEYPPYLLAELRFPYSDGLRFACALWLEGGWEAVDAAYRHPPASSASIMFPERYGDEPSEPAALGTLDEPWEEAHTETFGAAELLWLLEAPGGARAAALDAPRERAGAWDGGRLDLWTRGTDTALGLSLVERVDGIDRPDLCETVDLWYRRAFPEATVRTTDDHTAFAGPEQDAVLACEGESVRLGIGPTLEEAGTLAR